MDASRECLDRARGNARQHIRSACVLPRSLDAALTLVPEGWEYNISNRAIRPHAGRAYIHNRKLINVGGGMTPNPEYRGSETTAHTPILALCIAALKARAGKDTA